MFYLEVDFSFIRRSIAGYVTEDKRKRYDKENAYNMKIKGMYALNNSEYLLTLDFNEMCFNYLRPCICFASMLNVACGTARKRSLGMSLPVSRQMPYVPFSIRTRAAWSD